MSDNKISYVSCVSPSDAPSREILMKLGEQAQVPFLIDVDKGKWMYESADIVEYLEKNYV